MDCCALTGSKIPAMHVLSCAYANIHHLQSTHLATPPGLVFFQFSPPSGQISHVGSDLCAEVAIRNSTNRNKYLYSYVRPSVSAFWFMWVIGKTTKHGIFVHYHESGTLCPLCQLTGPHRQPSAPPQTARSGLGAGPHSRSKWPGTGERVMFTHTHTCVSYQYQVREVADLL